jgi:hypothetical protein
VCVGPVWSRFSGRVRCGACSLTLLLLSLSLSLSLSPLARFTWLFDGSCSRCYALWLCMQEFEFLDARGKAHRVTAEDEAGSGTQYCTGTARTDSPAQAQTHPHRLTRTGTARTGTACTDSPTQAQTHPHRHSLHRLTHTDSPAQAQPAQAQPAQAHPHRHRLTHTDSPAQAQPAQAHPHRGPSCTGSPAQTRHRTLT